MADAAVQPVGGLSEVERVVDTFVAPSKTFEDIRRKATWWLPFLIMIVVSFVFVTAVDKKVGFDTIAQQQIEKNKFAADRMAQLPPDQRAAQYQAAASRTKVISYIFPVFTLIVGAIVSLLWWLSLNFGLGAQTKFSQIFALWFYAGLPKILIYLISAILLFAGVGTENFDMQNPLGTNPGFYVEGKLRAALGFFDVFGLWSLALAVIGAAIIARKTKGQAAAVIVGWWVLALLVFGGLGMLTAG